MSLRRAIYALALVMPAALGVSADGFEMAKPALSPFRPLGGVVKIQTDAPTRFDAYGRLTDYPGKVEIDCPQQSRKTAVLLVFGQSNSANAGGQNFQAVDDRVVNFFAGKCYRAGSPLLGAALAQGESWTLLGNKLIAEGRFSRVILVPAGIGGTAVSEWASGGRLNPMLADVLDEARQTYKITHVLWHQGESDFVLRTDARDYASRFLSVYATLRKHGVEAPVYVCLASRAVLDARPWSEDNSVRLGQKSSVDGKDIFLGPDTDLLVGESDRYDSLHFSGSGQEKFAAAWLEILTR